MHLAEFLGWFSYLFYLLSFLMQLCLEGVPRRGSGFVPGFLGPFLMLLCFESVPSHASRRIP